MSRRGADWRVWVDAARPPTLSAAIAPVLVGSGIAVAASAFRVDVFLIALAAAILIQVGTNYANDLFDHLKRADRADRLGPPRATASGLVTPREMGSATALAFAAAAALGLYLVALGGLPILVVGLASMAAGFAYTAGPYPLGYHGLGDVFVFVFFGLIPVPAMAYLHTGAVTSTALAAAIPVGCIVTAILVVNNLRDIDQDRAAGKRTLAVLVGRRATRAWYLVLMSTAYLVPPLGALAGAFPATALAPLLTLPAMSGLGRAVTTADGRALNPALRGTSRLHLLFGALFALGLAVRG